MELDKKRAADIYKYEGATYCFCSGVYRIKFAENLDKHLTPAVHWG